MSWEKTLLLLAETATQMQTQIKAHYFLLKTDKGRGRNKCVVNWSHLTIIHLTTFECKRCTQAVYAYRMRAWICDGERHLELR